MNTHMKVPGFVDVGVIIGTHGATVKRLQEESGARINHNRDTGVFTISGSAEERAKAVELILHLVNKQAERTGREMLHGDQLMLPQNPGSSRQRSQVQQQPSHTRTQMSAEDAVKAMDVAVNMDFGALTDNEKLRASSAAKFICRSLEHH